MSNVETDVKLDFCDVLIKPKISHLKTRSEITEEDLIRTFKTKNKSDVRSPAFSGIGIISSNSDQTGNIETAKVMGKYKCFTALHKYYLIPNSEEWNSLVNFISSSSPEELNYIWFSIGRSKTELLNLFRLIAETNFNLRLKIICDVANGYQESFIDFVNSVKENSFFQLNNLLPPIVMAGNVVTPEITTQLVQAGADIVKCGIGSGSNCVTRLITGVGYPQLTAVLESSDAARQRGAYLCSDGGANSVGSICKAFGAGADMVMLGSFLAAHEQSGGELIIKDGKKYKKTYGMASKTAMNKFGTNASYKTAEGKCSLIPYKGDLKNTLQDIFGGLRSYLSYIGSENIKEASRRTTFIKVNRQLNDSLRGYEIEDNDY